MHHTHWAKRHKRRKNSSSRGKKERRKATSKPFGSCQRVKVKRKLGRNIAVLWGKRLGAVTRPETARQRRRKDDLVTLILWISVVSVVSKQLAQGMYDNYVILGKKIVSEETRAECSKVVKAERDSKGNSKKSSNAIRHNPKGPEDGDEFAYRFFAFAFRASFAPTLDNIEWSLIAARPIGELKHMQVCPSPTDGRDWPDSCRSPWPRARWVTMEKYLSSRFPSLLRPVDTMFRSISHATSMLVLVAFSSVTSLTIFLW